MAQDYTQRRRVALALAITVIAAPAAFLLNRSGGGNEPETQATFGTLVGTVPGEGGSVGAAVLPDTGSPDDTDALGTASAGYLSGTTVPADVGAAQIAVPRLPESVKGMATFSSSIDSTLTCHADATEVPFNATITVTNLDNSRSVQCVSSIGGAAPEQTVVLATETFAQIADLTDAPVPVQITWASN
jgi:hypothetical protein